MTGNYQLVYYDAENVGIIGIFQICSSFSKRWSFAYWTRLMSFFCRNCNKNIFFGNKGKKNTDLLLIFPLLHFLLFLSDLKTTIFFPKLIRSFPKQITLNGMVYHLLISFFPTRLSTSNINRNIYSPFLIITYIFQFKSILQLLHK